MKTTTLKILALAAPFYMPFVILGLFRAMWWAAGASWSEPGSAAATSTLFGLIVGAVIACIATEKGLWDQ